MQSPPPEKSFIIYLWIVPSKEEALTKPIDEFLHYLETYANFCKLLIEGDITTLNPCKYPLLNIQYTDQYKKNKDSISNLYPLLITSLSQFESEKEKIINYLKETDNSSLPKDNVFISSIEAILTKDEYAIFEEKKHTIGSQLLLAESLLTERPHHLHSYLTKAKRLLSLLDSFPSFIQNSHYTTFPSLFFRELYSLLLSAQVEIAYFMYAGINPVDGWINHQKSKINDVPVWEIRNPFLSISNNLECNGAISRIEYFPRRFLLNNSNNAFIFSLSDKETTHESIPHSVIQPKPASYRIMRNQPDLFGIRFEESLSRSECNPDESLMCSKVFYVRSGLGSFIPNSTTGFTSEYWLEGANDPEKNILLNLHFPLLFPASLENIKIRALSSFGGENEFLYSMSKNSDIQLKKKEVEGNLFGIRVIHTINHFIIDFRFSKMIEGVSIKGEIKDEETTLLNLNFTHIAHSLMNYDNLQTMHFCIY